MPALRHRHAAGRSAHHGLDRLGADIEIDGAMSSPAPKRAQGREIVFPKVTVAAPNAIMAASLPAHHVIENAPEPESRTSPIASTDGAKISGAGTSRIVIEGVAKLGGARHRVLPDRIETHLCDGGPMAGGMCSWKRPRGSAAGRLDVLVEAAPRCPRPIRARLPATAPDWAVEVVTARFRLPDRLQAQLMALMTCAKAPRTSRDIFENRFMHVQELARLGAVSVSTANAHIEA